MSNEFITFEKISRKSWKQLHQKSKPLLTQEELTSITSLNDNIDINDVVEVYLPLIHLIQVYKIAQENLSFSKSLFLKKIFSKDPLLLGFLAQLPSVSPQLAGYCSFFWRAHTRPALLSWSQQMVFCTLIAH